HLSADARHRPRLLLREIGIAGRQRAQDPVSAGDVTGTFGGGSTVVGGVDYSIQGVAAAGLFRAEYQPIGPNQEMMAIVYGSNQSVQDATNVFYPPGDYQDGWRINLVDESGLDVTATSLDITLHYDESIIAGWASEADLRPFQYDTSTGSWTQASLLGHDTSGNTMTIQTNLIAPIILGIPNDPLHAVASGSQVDVCHPVLSQESLESIVDEAIARLAAAGASNEQLTRLRNTEITTSDLPGTQLGAAGRDHIAIDVDGAGNGWYVDPTPGDDGEFTGDDRPKGVDLLTTVLHEMGHVLGHGHTDDEDHFMHETLAPGIRPDLDHSLLELLANAQVSELNLSKRL
ncbi:MAG: matrixin family metalloprotease, partial [Planctomycetota bacterium]